MANAIENRFDVVINPSVSYSKYITNSVTIKPRHHLINYMKLKMKHFTGKVNPYNSKAVLSLYGAAVASESVQ